MTKYSIVLPCFNEAENLPALVDRFRAFTENWAFELIVVDNGSTDDTSTVLERLANKDKKQFIKPHEIEENQGYGYGIRSGLNVAKGEILAFTHADAQTPPEDVFRAFELYRSGKLNPEKTIIKGRRLGREKGLLTTRGLGIFASFFVGLKIEDLNGQPKVFHKSLLKAMKRKVNNFAFDPYVLYCAKNQNLGIYNLDVNFLPRSGGKSKSAHSTLAKLRTIIGFMSEIVRFKS